MTDYRTAWDLCKDDEWEGRVFRVKGGRVLWDGAYAAKGYNSVALLRMEVGETSDDGIRTLRRYVHPDTPIVFVRVVLVAEYSAEEMKHIVDTFTEVAEAIAISSGIPPEYFEDPLPTKDKENHE